VVGRWLAMSERIAHAITEGLNETHRQVRAAKAEAVTKYKAQLVALDEKENWTRRRTASWTTPSAVPV
jgi:hypothetical protein